MSEPMTDPHAKCKERIKELELDAEGIRKILQNPDKWMKWCDIKMLEWNEDLQKRVKSLEAALKPLAEAMNIEDLDEMDIHRAYKVLEGK